MAILSSLFSDTSDSSGSSDLLGILDAAASIDASNESYDQTTDSDGSSHTSYDHSEFGTSLDVGSLLSNMTDQFGSSDSHSGGGLFG